MNYRHAFHAGNFADLLKHAALLALLKHAARRPEPLFVLGTHAGAGAYDLAGSRTGEAAAGVGRLMVEPSPPVFAPLRRAVAALNPGGGARFYPGSPQLIADALRPADRFVACELRPDDHNLLRTALKRYGARAEARRTDGYEAIGTLLPNQHANALVLIDPPYERGDEYHNVAAAAEAVVRQASEAVVLVWTPLKDLETFDALLRTLEGARLPSVLVVEARLRPLTDPMRLNGGALLLLNAPPDLGPPLAEAAGWIARRLGEPGGEGRVWRLDEGGT